MRNDYEIRGEITVIFLRTSKGETVETIIDTADLEKAKSVTSRWFPLYAPKMQSYYVITQTKVGRRYKTVNLHRTITGAKYRKQDVDHINHDILDNRSSNLRIVSHRENCRNARPRNFRNQTTKLEA